MTLLLFLLLAAPSPSPGSPGLPGLPGSSQREFEAAIQREAAGDWAGAATQLEQLARAAPDSNFADDALFEAAVLAEERLADPARAARLYREVTTRYPRSRLSRRARTRADFLDSSLRTGEAPLAEYQRILSQGARDPRGATEAMDRLLREHPDFALADRALFWIGARDAELGKKDEAMRRFVEVEQRFPSSEWARRAEKARADLLLGRGRAAEARALYDHLSHSTDPIARAGGLEGLAAVRTAIARRLVVAAALLYLVLFFGFHVLVSRGWRGMGKLPLELGYYLPVLFVGAGATENGAIGWATSGIAAGGALIIWTVAAGTAQRLARGSIPPVQRLLRAIAVSLAVLAIAYLAIQWAGLYDLVIETLRNGPER